MSTTEFQLDEFLDSAPVASENLADTDILGTEIVSGESWKEPEYEGNVDYRVRQLSYSSILTLHQCPRKFQLYKLRSTFRAETDEKSNITFAFGHVIGDAIQRILAGETEEAVIIKMFMGWHAPLYANDEKLDKSFFSALIAVQKFISMRQQGLLDGYELVYFDGKPATELSFAINFPDGFRMRGFVDAVLRHTTSEKVIVLECKTTGAKNLNPATYKNSSQAIGYSLVLDHICPDISSYEVLYLIYQTADREFTIYPFVKTYLQRAQWIQELLLDIEMIKLYENSGVYPMHGESCYNFYRECEYLQVCTLSTQYLTKPCTSQQEDKTEYQFNISLVDLLNTQMEKVT